MAELCDAIEQERAFEPLLQAFRRVFRNTSRLARLRSAGSDKVKLCRFCRQRDHMIADLARDIEEGQYRRLSLARIIHAW